MFTRPQENPPPRSPPPAQNQAHGQREETLQRGVSAEKTVESAIIGRTIR